jgi:hypothetical protein
MAPVFANNTMVCRARIRRSVCLGIALTDSAAAMYARGCVTLVRKPKKVKGMTGFAGRWLRERTPTTNAILANAMVPERVTSRKRRKQMARLVYLVRNARLAIA